jgi:hypothetical protein
MLADHAGDFLLQATAAGLFGLLVLAGYFALRQHWRDRATLTALPAGTAEALGTALAAVAAVACFGTAFDTELTRRGIGAGEPWSLAVAAAVAAVVFAVALGRARRRARPG